MCRVQNEEVASSRRWQSTYAFRPPGIRARSHVHVIWCVQRTRLPPYATPPTPPIHLPSARKRHRAFESTRTAPSFGRWLDWMSNAMHPECGARRAFRISASVICVAAAAINLRRQRCGTHLCNGELDGNVAAAVSVVVVVWSSTPRNGMPKSTRARVHR